MTDDAYILTDKHNHGYEISMKWIALTQGQIFSDFSSSSDNGTWNKTGFLKYALFDIPAIDEQVRAAAALESA